MTSNRVIKASTSDEARMGLKDELRDTLWVKPRAYHLHDVLSYLTSEGVISLTLFLKLFSMQLQSKLTKIDISQLPIDSCC